MENKTAEEIFIKHWERYNKILRGRELLLSLADQSMINKAMEEYAEQRLADVVSVASDIAGETGLKNTLVLSEKEKEKEFYKLNCEEFVRRNENLQSELEAVRKERDQKEECVRGLKGNIFSLQQELDGIKSHSDKYLRLLQEIANGNPNVQHRLDKLKH